MSPADEPHSDFRAITGVWRMLKAEMAGEAMPEFAARKIEFQLSSVAYTVRFDGAVSDAGTYVLNPLATPKTLQLTGLKGTNAGRVIPGIYQLVGDRLRVCFGMSGIAPVQFSTSQQDAFYLATYQRKIP